MTCWDGRWIEDGAGILRNKGHRLGCLDNKCVLEGYGKTKLSAWLIASRSFVVMPLWDSRYEWSRDLKSFVTNSRYVALGGNLKLFD